MSDRQDIYMLKPQRCLVTHSGQVLNPIHRPETSNAPATVHQEPDPEIARKKIPELRLFHHPV